MSRLCAVFVVQIIACRARFTCLWRGPWRVGHAPDDLRRRSVQEGASEEACGKHKKRRLGDPAPKNARVPGVGFDQRSRKECVRIRHRTSNEHSPIAPTHGFQAYSMLRAYSMC